MFYFLPEPCENSTCLQEQGEESSAASFSDIPASVLSRLNLIADNQCSRGNGTEYSQDSQSGTTCEPSTANPGTDSSMLSAEDSLVRTLVQAETLKELTGQNPVYGEKWPVSFARYNQSMSLWKTPQCSLFEDLTECSVIWPKWGMMQNGECWELPMPSGLKELRYLIMKGFDALLRLPTPTVCGNYNRKGASATSGDGLATALRRLPTPTVQDGRCRPAPKRPHFTAKGTLRHLNPQGVESQCRLQQQITDGGPMNPEWVEWFMGWPIGFTALQPLETDKFQQWLRSHGKPCPVNETPEAHALSRLPHPKHRTA